MVPAVRDRWPLVQIIVTSAMRGVDVTLLPILARFFAKPYSSQAVIHAMGEMTACQLSNCCCNIVNALGKNLTVTVEYDIDIVRGTILSGISDESVSSLFVRRRMSLSRFIACSTQSAEIGLPRLPHF